MPSSHDQTRISCGQVPNLRVCFSLVFRKPDPLLPVLVCQQKHVRSASKPSSLLFRARASNCTFGSWHSANIRSTPSLNRDRGPETGRRFGLGDTASMHQRFSWRAERDTTERSWRGDGLAENRRKRKDKEKEGLVRSAGWTGQERGAQNLKSLFSSSLCTGAQNLDFPNSCRHNPKIPSRGPPRPARY